MSDAERGAIAAVVGLAVILVLYAIRTRRSGAPWRQDLPAIAASIGVTLLLVLALLLGPPAVGLFGLPVVLVILGLIQLRQTDTSRRRLAWLTIAAGVGLLLLNLLRVTLFGT